MPAPGVLLSQAELLRTLGQELDRERAQLRHIKFDGDGFHVLALRDRVEVSHYYAPSEVEALSRRRRSSRVSATLARHAPSWLFGHRSAT